MYFPFQPEVISNPLGTVISTVQLLTALPESLVRVTSYPPHFFPPSSQVELSFQSSENLLAVVGLEVAVVAAFVVAEVVSAGVPEFAMELPEVLSAGDSSGSWESVFTSSGGALSVLPETVAALVDSVWDCSSAVIPPPGTTAVEESASTV